MKNCIVVLAALALVCVSQAGIITVDDDAPGGFATIQAGIDSARDGDTVLVADGVYRGAGNRDIDFRGKAITVRSANGPEKCVIDCEGSKTDPHRGFYLHEKEDANSVIDGFTITGGYLPETRVAGAIQLKYSGGAILCVDSSPIIKNCIIIDNYASRGGGVFCHKSSPTITQCVLRRNLAYHTGGLYCYGNSAPVVTDCVIRDNSSDGGAGGVFFYKTSSTPRLIRCTITGNSSYWGAGGVRCALSSPIITDCIISGNVCRANDAGGIHCSHSSAPQITNCVISGNASGSYSGSITCDTASPTIQNCVISGNGGRSDNKGLLARSRSSPEIINCTICNNFSGGGISCSFSEMTVTNCIIWGNSSQAIIAGRSYVEVSYSNIEGGWPGEGNISEDPLFVMDGADMTSGVFTGAGEYDPAENLTFLSCRGQSRSPGELVNTLIAVSSKDTLKQFLIGASTADSISVVGDVLESVSPEMAYRFVDYRLQENSPCIDTGSRDGAARDDISGSPRDANPDMGAYEVAKTTVPDQYGTTEAVMDTVSDEASKTVEPDQPETVQTAVDAESDEALQTVVPDQPETVHVAMDAAFDEASIVVPVHYKTIQAAIDAASEGDRIVVLDGVYKGDGNRDIDFKGKAITLASLNGPANCIIDCQGKKDQYHRGFYFHSKEGKDTVLDGFKIINGFAQQRGGGIYCYKSSPRIQNCTISRCRAAGGNGGAINCNKASPAIVDCLISANRSPWGGGVALYESSATLTNCMLADNTASVDGGGINCRRSSAVITDCVIIGNVTEKQNGGGVNCLGDSSRFVGCIISGNEANSWGGGVYCNGSAPADPNSAPAFINCVISGNSGKGGGGIHAQHGQMDSTINLVNCLISGNTASRNGSGIDCIETSLTATNCTIAGNMCEEGAGAVQVSHKGGLRIANSILWSNRPKEVSFKYGRSEGPLVILHSDVRGGWEGESNFDADPLFVMDGPDAVAGTWMSGPVYDRKTNRTVIMIGDENGLFAEDELAGFLIEVSANGRHAFVTSNTSTQIELCGDLRTAITKGGRYRLVDYYLRAGSPCVDAGTAEGAPDADIYGETRLGKPDAGAYELALVSLGGRP